MKPNADRLFTSTRAALPTSFIKYNLSCLALVAGILLSGPLLAQTKTNDHTIAQFRQKHITNISPARPYGDFNIHEFFRTDPLKEAMIGLGTTIEEAIIDKLDLSREYVPGTKEYACQRRLLEQLSELLLAFDSRLSLLSTESLTQSQLDLALVLCEDAKKLVEKHPLLPYLITGAEKQIIHAVSGKIPDQWRARYPKLAPRFEQAIQRKINTWTDGQGFAIFKELETYRDQKIEPWEDHSYLRIDEIPLLKRECLPPAYRKKK
jgi:hypothetical protein